MADTSGDSSLGGGGAATAAVPAGDGPCCCRVPGCTEPLQSSHNVKYRICEAHARAPTVIIDGGAARHCQQCGSFHELSAFDDGRRSCRASLELHQTLAALNAEAPSCAISEVPSETKLLSMDADLELSLLASTGAAGSIAVAAPPHARWQVAPPPVLPPPPPLPLAAPAATPPAEQRWRWPAVLDAVLGGADDGAAEGCDAAMPAPA
ncbi:squamosa promoter-binding 7 isoform C [Micractinium conductrix]|uniref:Squamosa promoter-binding 7 isoform B n=1 Tax=Micractinium conductrix TaxID=554055 RepID=A0A2P6V4X7_9CHLO|nr:squamosa promoter-binding 7 isoform B [Micractinium conductrix]PSC69134.1 squamosa promoter-binding 7 isoform C [Micractinium conductrix]|eukprot:PSC69133.1 squamosa promoter-binding 7 isoform B [Micractinium conductrix]